MPPGAAGELLIGGAGVALGYLNRPELTAEKFVDLPLADPLALPAPASSGTASGVARFYRTGDLVRWLDDGNLIFAGRADDQVKIRGYRVEPGEVEAAVAALPGVEQAAVVARKDGPTPRLVAYVVPASPDVDVAALRETLATRLPDYLLPAAFVTLPELPLTPNGKVDRRRLPEPDLSASGSLRVEPSTPEEQLLAGLFSSLLGVEQVAATDSFFDLGGHSLLVTRLASRIHEVFGVDVPLRALFENPTVAGMAHVVSAARGDAGATVSAPPIEPLPRGADGLPLEPPPLSFGQQRLWFLDQLEPGLLSYNTPAAIRLDGDLDLDALGYALNEIVRRHEVLRTSFGARRGDPVQLIAPAQPIDLNLDDLTGIDPPGREAEALRRAGDDVRRPFDLATGPLLRVRIFRLGERDHLAVLTAHHIVADGWSLGILTGELTALYAAHRSGQPAALPPLPVQYAEYAAWQRAWLETKDAGGASPLQAQLDYWKAQLAGIPARLDLPTDRPRPPVQSSNGSTYTFRLTGEQQKGLNALARGEGATLYMVLLAAYQTLLSRYSGQGDVTVGSVVASRTRPELEPLIGFFVNTLVFRTRFDGQPTFRDVIARAREAALGAYAHQDVPFEMLVDAVQPRREMSHTPLFQAALSLQNLPMPAEPLPGLTLRSVEIDRGTAQFDMLLTFTELDDGLGAAWEYNTDLFDRSTIERMARNLRRLIDAALANPDEPVATLALLDPAERDLVLDAWNATAVPFPDDTTIHALISEWAVTTPNAPAAAFAGGGQLSYAELNARANQLAHHLVALGVERGALVGLSVERSLDMVVGILGILKAGAAYLPLDPNYPPDRLAFMLADSGIRVLLTQAAVLPRLPLAADAGIRSVRLDADWPEIAALPSTGPAVAVGPAGLAYCIYTSGSTGRPKGALLAHRGLCNLADEQARRFGLVRPTGGPGKRVLQFSAFSFDASVWETVMALRSGATLVLAPQETLASGPDLLKLLQAERITTVTLPPSLLSVLSPSELPELETVIAAGERCTNEIVRQWAPGRRFFNAYGPTETTVCATMRRCEAGEDWVAHRSSPDEPTSAHCLGMAIRP
jgi:amino acid adenylation domain-containing protein